MKRLLLALSAMALCSTSALAADVGVSISIGQPGFFGQLDIGDFPPPALIYSRPVIIERIDPDVVIEPLYLHVPPSQARNWRRYCRLYDACGRPVYFVQDSWYNDVYVPRYRERYIDRDDRDYDRHEDHDEDHYYDREREERRDRDDDERDEHHGREEHHNHGHGEDRD
jgi:hypothetical protein